MPPDPFLDAALWQSYTHCNRNALGDLYDEYFDKINAYLIYFTNLESLSKIQVKEAEDRTHDFFLEVLARKVDFAQLQIQDFCAWAYKCCFNNWLSDIRKEKNREEILKKRYLPRQKKYDLLDQKTDYEKIFACIFELDDIQQKIIILEIEGYNNQEMKGFFDISDDVDPDKWIVNQKYQAKLKLKEWLKRKGLI